MRRMLCLLALLIGLLPPAWAQVYLYPPAEGWTSRPLLTLTVLSHRQSDCLLLTCGGQAMLIDGGYQKDALALLALMGEGSPSFQYMLNTHYHEDHITGLISLLQQGIATGVYLHPYPPTVVGNASHNQALQLCQQLGIPAYQVQNGDSLLLGEAVITLWRNDEGASTNARSVMAHVRFGTCSMLLTGDIIGDTQTWCVATLPPHMLDVDVLKAPHHGVSPMVGDFLSAVSPQALLVTNNRERAEDGAAQARQCLIPTLFTEDGVIIAQTDGDDWHIYHQP